MNRSLVSATVIGIIGIVLGGFAAYRWFVPKAVYSYVNVSLSYDAGTGNCSQQVVGSPPAPLITVTSGEGVTWQPATAGQAIDVQFPPTASPFYDSNSSNGSPVASGQASGSPGTAYPYQSVTIGGNQCQNAGALGLRMK